MLTVLGMVSIALSSCRERNTSNERDNYDTPIVPDHEERGYGDDPINTREGSDPMIDHPGEPSNTSSQNSSGNTNSTGIDSIGTY